MKKQKYNDYLWWKNGVIYHIYPRSFYDSNNDGIGDIQGIIENLDYLYGLGIDAIWLSPIYKSPFFDGGYDVSDFYDIDPSYGTLDDFKLLLKKAHGKNIRVIMDLIMNHTSCQHPWFLESSSSINSPKRDWYIWHEGKRGRLPNNWKNQFGGSAWEYHKESGQYYYHSFFKEQPDLNWRSNGLKKAYFKMVDYWLNMGVDGFRLDVVNLIVKDKKFRDNPGLIQMINGKGKVYTRNRPKSIKLLKGLRKLVDRYDERMCVGEIYTLPPGEPEVAGSYLGIGNDVLNLAFDFSLIFKSWKAKAFVTSIKKWYSVIPKYGWPCNVFSNHDLLRSINRPFWRRNKEQKALVLAFLLFTLRGTPFVYYGEEIGMYNARVPRKKIIDPLGKRFWPFFMGRDVARTPMQWNADRHAGFSDMDPWLPLNKNYLKINVESQKNSKRSVFWYYRKLIRIRRKHNSLNRGKWNLIKLTDENILAYIRSYQQEDIIVLLNFSNSKSKNLFFNPNPKIRVLLSTHKKQRELLRLNNLVLNPFESGVFLVLK